jgi:hypothetical protein
MDRSKFIRGLLDDPRDPQLPQYDPQGGWNTARFAGERLAAMTGPGGVADAFGLLGAPSVAEQVRSGDYLDAGLTALGVLPFVGAIKGVRAAKNLSRAEVAAAKQKRIADAIAKSKAEQAAEGAAPNAQPVAETPAVKAAVRNMKKKSVADVYDNVDDYETAKKMAKRGDHLKQDKAGNYVGAPEGIDSPSKLGAMRSAVDDKVEAGAFNADWYDRARDAYSQASGYDPAIHGQGANVGPEGRMAALFSRGGAVYSPQAAPSYETNGFLKQHNNKVILGQDIRPKTQAQADRVAAGYVDNPYTGGFDFQPQRVKQGKKTGPYADAKDPTIDDTTLYKTANDIWHGRVFGYTNTDGTHFDRAFTPQEHGFLTGENVLASERATKKQIPIGVGHNSGVQLQWTPRRMQAATWGAEREAQAFADQNAAVAKYESDLEAWKTAPKGERGAKPTQPKVRTPEEIRAYARYGIDDSFANHPANATYEYVTGANTGHLKGLLDAPEPVRQAYTDEIAALYGPRDPYYEALQMYQLPQLRTQGEFVNSAGQLERNPGMTARPLAEIEPSTYVNSKGKEATGGPQMGQASREALGTVEFLRSALNAQEAGAANKFTPANSSSKPFEKTGMRLVGDPAQLNAAKAALEAQGLSGVNVGDALHVGVFPDNGVLKIGDEVVDGTHIQNRIKQANAAAPDAFSGVSGTVGRFESLYEPVPWGAEGAVTNAIIDRMATSPIHNLPQRLDASRLPSLLGQQNTVDRQFAVAHGFPENDRIYKLRQLLSDPRVGFSGLPAYVKKHGTTGLPALVGAPFLPGLLGQNGQQTEEYPAPGF